MSVILDGDIIHLRGDCRVEDAEPLLGLLLADPRRSVDLRAAGPLHAAIVQVLLAKRPPLTGPAGDPFTATWLAPILSQEPDA